ncbi:MAG: hypothetical protein RSC11_02540 [Mucinivorans sp.]
MNGHLRQFLATVCLVVLTSQSFGQFYSTGRSSGATPLLQIKTDHYQLVFPRSYTQPAVRLSKFLDTIRPYISTGIGVAPRSVPIVMRTGSVYSNGYVTWAPRREELVMMPPASTYALTWDKQLLVHEWRHVTQITALNHGLTRIASWLLGEAGYAVGLAVMSNWQLEGDATIAETDMAEFGRALQPDFTVGYRTLFADGQRNFKNLDRWVCNSFWRPHPDIYKYGYQVMSETQEQLGVDSWGKILRYSGRWPIFIFPDAVWLSHNHHTSYRKIARRRFQRLDSLWTPLAQVDENFEDITTPLVRNYTTYQWPVKVADGVVALKTDWNLPTRLVSLDSTEKRIKYVGPVSSPLVAVDSMLYWTEFRPHPIYEQESFSSICSFDLRRSRRQDFDRRGHNYFVTPLDSNRFATVSYDEQMRGYIQFFDSKFKRTTRHTFPENDISIHGLSYDRSTRTLAYIGLDERGMWIGAIDSLGQDRPVTRPSVVTVSDLRAQDGQLYFSSIESGRNEVHSIDLASGVERQLTYSKFGGSQPVHISGDTVLLVSERARGQMISRVVVDSDTARRVEWTRKPKDLFSLSTRLKWDVPRVDTISTTSVALDTLTNVKRYRRFSHLFNLHSWAPISFDGDYLMNDRPLRIAFGVSAFFQSTMSDFEGFATYGWVNERNWVKGNFLYKGLPVNISLSAEYGGGDQLIYGNQKIENPDLYFSTGINLSLPLNFSSANSTRLFQPSASFHYSNAKLWDASHSQYDMGYVNYKVSLWWSSSRRTAYRALAPRLGYAVRLGAAGAFDGRFATQWSILTRGYLPGVGANHSIAIHAGAQYQRLANFNFTSKVLVPRGLIDMEPTTGYFAGSIDYKAPVAYPDWGWDGVLFFRRIWAGLFADYSMGRYLVRNSVSQTSLLQERWSSSYGVNIGIDFTLFRSFEQGITLILAQPRDQKFYVEVGYKMTF